MKIRNIIVLVISVMLIQGCVGVNSGLKPKEKIEPNNGVFVISASRKGAGVASVFIKSESGKLYVIESSGILSGNIEEGEVEGNAYAFQGKPGIYKLTTWQLYIYSGITETVIGPKKIEPITFEVKPGQITYLGNYHIDTLYGKNILGIDIPAGAKITISDKEYRDLSIAKKEHPNIANMPVLKSVSNIQNWGLE